MGSRNTKIWETIPLGYGKSFTTRFGTRLINGEAGVKVLFLIRVARWIEWIV